MRSTVLNPVKAILLIALGLAIAAMSLYVGEVDDAPGAGVIGLLMLVATVVLGLRTVRNQLPRWASRVALGVVVVLAVLAAVLTRGVVAAAPIFPLSAGVPSVVASTPSSQYTDAVERARELVRAAIVAQNLPGLSVAVGAGDTVVWAEGFGWRDVGTQTPVTPDTRFHIGSAASVVTPAVASLGLTHTGSDEAKVWSPEAIGEEGEDFPPFTIIRHHVLQPLGLAPAEYPLPGDRATFYVPRVDNKPRLGRRLMYMRDLACCVDGLAYSSTPSDLVRVALATRPGNVNGELAGGTVMSLATAGDNSVVVAVTSNIAYANTSALAQAIQNLFAAPSR